MERELKFATNVLTNAEYQPKVISFYERAYLDSDTTDNFRTLPSIKTKDRIGNVTFGNLLQKAGCSWESANLSIGAIEVDVETVDAMIEICQYELEQSFVAEQMAAGTGGQWQVPAFMSYVWEQAGMEVNEEIELIRWNGIKGSTSFDEDMEFCKYVDGYIKRLNDAETGVTATLTGGTVDAGAAVLQVNVGKKGNILSVVVTDGGDYSVAPTAVELANVGEGEGATFTISTTGVTPNIVVSGITVVTSGEGYKQRVITVTGAVHTAVNILSEMGSAFVAIPKSIRRRKDLLRWHVSPVTADLYRQATAAGNTVAFITKALDLTYLDIKLVVNDGMPDNTMVLTRKDNLLYCFDGTTDGKQLEVIDMSKTTAEPKLRARTALRLGFHLANEGEIVYYRP